MTEYLFEYYDEETDKVYECTAFMSNTFEPNYGADIDGQRGVKANLVEVKDIHISDLSGEPVVDNELAKRVEKEFARKHDLKAREMCIMDYHTEKEYRFDD